MRTFLCVFSVAAVFVWPLAWASEAQGQWSSVSIGDYVGYAEIYAVNGGAYIIEGCTNMGGECGLRVSEKGVDCDGEFFPWDAPGFQASRDTKEGRQRINFRGRIGGVVVADLTWEEPKGKVVNVMRMCVALADESQKMEVRKVDGAIEVEVKR